MWMNRYKMDHFLKFYKSREWYRYTNPEKNRNVKSTDPYVFSLKGDAFERVSCMSDYIILWKS